MVKSPVFLHSTASTLQKIIQCVVDNKTYNFYLKIMSFQQNEIKCLCFTTILSFAPENLSITCV